MAKQRNFKRMFVGGDLHCGHRVGLTPPGWQLRPCEDEPKRMKWLRIEQECWDWYAKTVSSLKPFDVAVWNGDLIDGTGHRSGGTELICTDRNQQIEMATKCIQHVGAASNVVIAGTAYHTGESEDMEETIAHNVGAKFGSHEWVSVSGKTFDFKHHIGSSSIPHGRVGPLAKEELWNSLWNEAGYAPKADYIIRAHVHYCVGGWRLSGLRTVHFATIPALQGMGSKYGARRCSGLVDFGFYVFDIYDNGEVSWHRKIGMIASQKATALTL